MKLAIAFLVLATAVVLLAADKPDFSGAWRLEGAKADSAPALTIEQKDSELRMSGGEAKETTKVDCNTMGKDCEATLGGQRVTVSYWYSGPTLVEIAREGKNNNRVTETRRRLSDDGQKMLVEVISVVPSGKAPEKLVFVKDQQMAATPAASERR